MPPIQGAEREQNQWLAPEHSIGGDFVAHSKRSFFGGLESKQIHFNTYYYSIPNNKPKTGLIKSSESSKKHRNIESKHRAFRWNSSGVPTQSLEDPLWSMWWLTSCVSSFDLEKTASINLTQYISQVELPQPCDHGNFKKAPGRDNFTWGELSFHVLHAHSSETNFASIGIVSLWIHPRHRSPSVMHTTLYWYYIINCDVWKEIAASFAKVSSDAQLRSAQFFPKVWLFLQPTEHGYWSWDLRKPRDRKSVV